MAGLRLARRVEINRASGQVLIDGEEFGFFLAAEPISITIGAPADEVSVVRLAVVVDPDGVVLFDGTRPAPGEHAVPPADREGEDG